MKKFEKSRIEFVAIVKNVFLIYFDCEKFEKFRIEFVTIDENVLLIYFAHDEEFEISISQSMKMYLKYILLVTKNPKFNSSQSEKMYY